MKNNQPKAIFLKDYTAPDYLVEQIDLTFDLYEEHTRVISKLKLNRNQMFGKHQRPLILNGEELKLISIKIDGRTLSPNEYELSDRSLTLPNDLDVFDLEIETEIYPQKNTTLSGLYRSDAMFCTQCEAEGFRRITYYLDRPDVMAPFSTTIKAEKAKYPVLLSNGNPVAQGDEGSRHWVTWEDPYKKPAYLFALVAGDLAQINDTFTTKSGRKVKCAIYSEPENINQCNYAMEALKHSMKWDEETYGREYDLDIYMIVAVNDFNMGAMENKGLNIFNAKYVLVDHQTSTDHDFTGVELVIGHEYFHNWTGNRVTLRDWFQLSLKEGLTVFREQQFSQNRGSPVVKRITDVKHIRTRQFAEDSGPIAHPVRPHSYIEINNFYTMTIYYKGSEVIRMLNTMLGQENFRKGMDLYFERHDGQAVTIEHFVNAMNDANPDVKHFDFNQFMNWYTQAGTPIVEVSQGKADNGKINFIFKQSCPPTPNQPQKEPFVIPIKLNLYQPDGTLIDLKSHPNVHQTKEGNYFILSKAQDTLTIETNEKKLIPSLLGDFSAPVKLEYAYEPQELVFIVQNDEDGFNRWDKSQELYCTVIEDLLNKDLKGEQIRLPDVFEGLYQSLLHDNKTDPALLAELISLPSFYYIAENLPVIPADKLNQVISGLREIIAKTFEKDIYALYERCCQQDTGKFEPAAVGYRTLKNTTLSMLGRTQNEAYVSLIEKQYDNAKNMTDRMGAMSAINHWMHPLRKRIFEDFYQTFKQETLVVDKWLAVQALSELPDTLSTIEALMKHEAFDIKTPNKVYALIRNFAASNPTGFYHPSGKGYEFLADQVIALNQQNPQVASRILEPLTQWKRLEDKHAKLMKQSLERIKAQDSLSEDVFELVTKSLA